MEELLTTSNITTTHPGVGIDNDAVRYTYLLFLIITLLSSIIGDSIILAASIFPNGIRLNRFIVTVMQHIAVSDLISCFSFVLPTIIIFITNRWVISEIVSYIRLYVDVTVFAANTLLICLMSTSKLFLLLNPANVLKWTIKRAHISCAIVWFFTNVFSMIYAIIKIEELRETSFETPAIDYLAYFRIGITQIFPFLIMIATTILILLHLAKARRVSKRINGNSNLRGVATVVITVVVYCVSVIPTFVTNIKDYIVRDYSSLELAWFSTSFSGLNIMSNIYVYYFTIPSLREYIKVRVLRMSYFLSDSRDLSRVGIEMMTRS